MNTVFQLSIESECLIFRVKELDFMWHISTLLFIILYYFFTLHPGVQIYEIHLFIISVLTIYDAVNMGRVIRGQRKGAGSIFIPNTEKELQSLGHWTTLNVMVTWKVLLRRSYMTLDVLLHWRLIFIATEGMYTGQFVYCGKKGYVLVFVKHKSVINPCYKFL